VPNDQNSGKLNGTKKKVRSNGCLKSQSQEYFELWSLGSNDVESHSVAEQTDLPLEEEPTPQSSSSFKYHRPLERSWPPKRDLKVNRHSLEDFSFDIIDIDEQLFYGASNLSGMEFPSGEFFERNNKKQKNEKFGKVSIQMETLSDPPPETDGSLAESLRGSKLLNDSPDSIPKHLKGKPTVALRSDQIAQTDLSFDPDLAVAQETVSKLFSTDEAMPEASIRPHRPLTRALSTGKSAASNNYNFEDIPMNGLEVNGVGRSTFLNSLSPRQRSPPSGSSTRSGSPLDSSSPDRISPIITVIHPKPIRPQPRPLTVRFLSDIFGSRHLISFLGLSESWRLWARSVVTIFDLSANAHSPSAAASGRR
jgi:E3 ubiquitin-protein ligase HECW2